jgi:hypothetical protein
MNGRNQDPLFTIHSGYLATYCPGEELPDAQAKWFRTESPINGGEFGREDR